MRSLYAVCPLGKLCWLCWKKVLFPEMSDTTKILTRAAINLFFNGFFADIVFSFLVSFAFFVFLFFFFVFILLLCFLPRSKISIHLGYLQVPIFICVFITLKVESSICKSNLWSNCPSFTKRDKKLSNME